MSLCFVARCFCFSTYRSVGLIMMMVVRRSPSSSSLFRLFCCYFTLLSTFFFLFSKNIQKKYKNSACYLKNFSFLKFLHTFSQLMSRLGFAFVETSISGIHHRIGCFPGWFYCFHVIVVN